MEIYNNDLLKFRKICENEIINFPTFIVDIPKYSKYEAVFIEFRVLPNIEFLIKNAIFKLGKKWCHTIVCGNTNFDYINNMCKNISSNINIIKYDYNNINRNTYNSILSSKLFWEKLYGDKILIYQEDSFIFRDNIEEFLEYDYVGAPWVLSNVSEYWLPKKVDYNKLDIMVGNGGLSLRTRKCMLDVISTIKNTHSNFHIFTKKINYYKDKIIAEDIYFSRSMIMYNIGIVAPKNIAMKFSIENTYYKNPFGGHQFWKSMKNWDTFLIKSIHENKKYLQKI
tara:strand:- start:413 stop:1258 length:846 start_codon:yes stop_codon:yes gene_type:complete